LGGGKKLMIGNLIAIQFGSSRNWPFGSAASLILMTIVMVALLPIIPSAVEGRTMSQQHRTSLDRARDDIDLVWHCSRSQS
ncbi:MAG: hypothetical protein AAGD40_08135, partial [Pseudomonadota bacterium]